MIMSTQVICGMQNMPNMAYKPDKPEESKLLRVYDQLRNGMNADKIKQVYFEMGKRLGFDSKYLKLQMKDCKEDFLRASLRNLTRWRACQDQSQRGAARAFLSDILSQVDLASAYQIPDAGNVRSIAVVVYIHA